MSASTLAKPSPATAAGKYLTFVLGQEYYGIEGLKVMEIIRMVEITPVPQMPAYIKGVINLRGKVIPVVDLRIKFNLSKAETTERTCIVVVQTRTSSGGTALMGVVVDAVEEVLNIAQNEIEPTPDFSTGLNTDYMIGMAKVKGSVKTLIDIDRVIAGDQVQAMAA
jgi:purine-binding chemotaxis protein CheW